MVNWREFEQKSLEYLESNYGNYASFKKLGESNSTMSDILVTTNRNESFFIEVKSAVSQSGQFVVMPDRSTNSFTFSQKNKSQETDITELFINYMDDNWDTFNLIGTAPIKIPLEKTVLSKWIMDYYKSKNVRFFISENKSNFVIIPIDDFEDAFVITAQVRRKKSGTRPLAKKYLNSVSDYFESNYGTANIIQQGKHYYLKKDVNIPDLQKITIDIPNVDILIYLSEYDANAEGYRINITSNTSNPNVIFSIQLKNNVVGISRESFLKVFIQ